MPFQRLSAKNCFYRVFSALRIALQMLKYSQVCSALQNFASLENPPLKDIFRIKSATVKWHSFFALYSRLSFVKRNRGIFFNATISFYLFSPKSVCCFSTSLRRSAFLALASLSRARSASLLAVAAENDDSVAVESLFASFSS